MVDAVEPERMQPWVTEQHLEVGTRGRVALEDEIDVATNRFENHRGVLVFFAYLAVPLRLGRSKGLTAKLRRQNREGCKEILVPSRRTYTGTAAVTISSASLRR